MSVYKTHALILLLLLAAPSALLAQQGHYQGTEALNYLVRKNLSISGKSRHAAVFPVLQKDIVTDTALYDLTGKIHRSDKAFAKLQRSLYLYRKDNKATIIFYPLLDGEAGIAVPGSPPYGGGAVGINLQTDLGKQLTIGGYGRLSQSWFPGYIDDEVFHHHVAPACGYATVSKMGGYHYWDWDVYANYSFLKYFNLEAGMGRNFWGDGYRTFFLSDQNFSYPYIKLTTSAWHLKYVNLYAQLKDSYPSGAQSNGKMGNKYGSFHFLSWDVSKRVNIGFFEAIIWQNSDSSMHRGFDVNYINPLIFYRPVEFSIGSPDNSLMGFSMKVKVAKKNFFYGQFVMDDIIWGEFTGGSVNRIKHWINPNDSIENYGYWTNKQAWQLGFISYDIFKINGLDLQIEYNAARPYTFSHRRPEVNYTQNGEPLAHPAGANFHEFLGFIRYAYKKYFFQLEGMYLMTGLDSSGTHYGSDILKPTFDTYYPEYQNIPVQQYGNSIGQGIRSHTIFMTLKATRLLIPAMNLRAEAALTFRQQQSALFTDRGVYFSVGLKTSWFNPSVDR